VWHRRDRDLVGADHVDLEQSPVDLGRCGLEVVVGDPYGCARVIDQYVEAAEARDRLRDESSSIIRISNVTSNVVRTIGAKLSDQRLAGVDRGVRVDDHVRPCARQPSRHGGTDAGGRAGDERDALSHQPPPREVIPPSITIVCPVIQLASSESRNAASFEVSLGMPRRFIG
jgi:hypothetical protein